MNMLTKVYSQPDSDSPPLCYLLMERTQGGSCRRCQDSIRVVVTLLQARGLPRQCGSQPQVHPVLMTGTKIPVGWAESFHSISDRSCVDKHLYLERMKGQLRLLCVETRRIPRTLVGSLGRGGAGQAPNACEGRTATADPASGCPRVRSMLGTLDPLGDKVSTFLQCLARLNSIHVKVHIWKIIVWKRKGMIHSDSGE